MRLFLSPADKAELRPQDLDWRTLPGGKETSFTLLKEKQRLIVDAAVTLVGPKYVRQIVDMHDGLVEVWESPVTAAEGVFDGQ